MSKREAADGDRPHSRRLAALGRANQIRGERAELKARIRAGEISVSRLIADPPQCLANAGLAELLLAVPGVGKVRVGRLLERTRLSPNKALGSLTDRQRGELERALGSWQ
jgi:hypothetical protein